MSIKERPLIKAVEGADPLPGFFFSHPIVSGFFSMLMCALFGAGGMLFWSLYGRALELYESVRMGAVVATAFASVIFLGIFVSAFREPEERGVRLQFVLGGALALACLVALDQFGDDRLRAFFENRGLLICTQTSGCS